GRRVTGFGVADDDVQPPVLLRVRVRLVTRVDDRPLQRRLEADLLLEEVGPLAELVATVARPVLAADLAGAGEHLAGHEPRQEVTHPRGPPHPPVPPTLPLA